MSDTRHMPTTIDEIEADIRAAAKLQPRLAPIADAAFNGVRASWERAFLPEKRLSNAARASVAAAVMRVVASMEFGPGSGKQALAVAGRLFRKALALKPEPTLFHVGTELVAGNADWTGAKRGPWRAEAEGLRLDLAYQPGLPGAEWVVHVERIPVFHAETPENLLQSASAKLHLLSAVDRAGAVHPFGFKRRVLTK